MDEVILAFDYGEKRIGVARANKFARLPEPLTVISSEADIKALIDEHRPSELVVGLPRSLDGSDSQQTKAARDFSARLEAYSLPVHLQDEALTSVVADEMAKQQGPKYSQDALAAAIILRDYLEANKA